MWPGRDHSHRFTTCFCALVDIGVVSTFWLSGALLLGARVCMRACVSEDPFSLLGVLGAALPSCVRTSGWTVGGVCSVGWNLPLGGSCAPWAPWELPGAIGVVRGPRHPQRAPLPSSAVVHLACPLEGSLEVLTEARWGPRWCRGIGPAPRLAWEKPRHYWCASLIEARGFLFGCRVGEEAVARLLLW